MRRPEPRRHPLTTLMGALKPVARADSGLVRHCHAIVPGVDLVHVYRLQDDRQHVDAVKRATQMTTDYGLVPEPALFGSTEWWTAIASGRLPKRRHAGSVSRVFWGSMGDYPMFEMTEDAGEVSAWHREGDVTLYVEGLHVVVTTVVQQLRRANAPPHEVILEILLQRSSARSSPFGPGPFAREGATDLFRPVGEAEADLIVAGQNRFPPRLPHQPIFYPVTNFEYARQIARDWNAKEAASGYAGYVTRFYVDTDFLSRYEVHQVGGAMHREYWIPAEELEHFNDHLIGPIEFVDEFHHGELSPPRRQRFDGRRVPPSND